MAQPIRKRLGPSLCSFKLVCNGFAPRGSLPFTQHHVFNYRGSLGFSKLPFDFAPGHIPNHGLKYLTIAAGTSCSGSDNSHATAPSFHQCISAVCHKHVVCLTHITTALSGLDTRHSRRHIHRKQLPSGFPCDFRIFHDKGDGLLRFYD